MQMCILFHFCRRICKLSVTETSNWRKTHLHTTYFTYLNVSAHSPVIISWQLAEVVPSKRAMTAQLSPVHISQFGELLVSYGRILRFQSNSAGRRSPQSSFSHVAFIRQPSCWLYKETSFKSKAPGEPWGGGAGNLFLIDVYTIKAERCLHWVIGETAEVWVRPAVDETCSVIMWLRGEKWWRSRVYTTGWSGCVDWPHALQTLRENMWILTNC